LHLCIKVNESIGYGEYISHLYILLQLAVGAHNLFDNVVVDLNFTVNYLPDNHNPLPVVKKGIPRRTHENYSSGDSFKRKGHLVYRFAI
jgi:hypothetical protein